MEVYEELKAYFSKNGIKQTEIAESLNVQKSFISELLTGKRTLGSETAIKLNKVYGFNIDWLLTGNGTMFHVAATTDIDPQKQEEKKDVLMVPVINLDARGGFQANEAVDVPQYVVGQLPFSTNVAQPGDFVIEIHGDSMYPRYPSGSYILLREIPLWREYLELSIPYVLELGDGRRLAKIVMKGDDADHYTLHSVNPDFQDTTIATSFINKVFMVVMMLKKETV